MSYRLRIEEPARAPREVPVDRPLIIGREESDVALSDATVSRQHLRISPAAHGLQVQDLGSTHGSVLRGQRITVAEVGIGDVIEIGATRVVVLGPVGSASATAAFSPDLAAAARGLPSPPPAAPPPPPGAPWAVAPLPAPPASGGPASSGLATATQILAWVWGGFAGLAGLLAFAAAVAVDAWWDAPARSDFDELAAWIDADDLFTGMLGWSYLVGLALLILLMVFGFQTHKAQDRFGIPTRRWTRGWTVGAWFIPLANAVIPALVFSDIEQTATTYSTRPPRQAPVWAGTVVWWVAAVGGTLLANIGSAVYDGGFTRVGAVGSVDQVVSGYTMMGLAGLIMAGTGAATALLVRRIAAADAAAG